MIKLKQKAKQLVAGTALLGMLYSPALATQKKEEKPKQVKKGTFAIEPTYSIPGQYGSLKFKGSTEFYGIGVGGFLDMKSTKQAPLDISKHFGKITASKGLDGLVKGAGLAVEYTTMSPGKDELRAGIYKKGKLGDGMYKICLYPIAPKGKGPHVILSAKQKLSDKMAIEAFITSDLGAKKYYGEAMFTYGLAKDFSFIFQQRYGGKFGDKFKPQTHVGLQIKF